MGLTDRLAKLEQAKDDGPMLTMVVTDRPTPQQQATIDRCIATGRRLLVFFMPTDTAWMPGAGAPPWEVDHA